MPKKPSRQKKKLEKIWSREEALLELKRVVRASIDGTNEEVRTKDGDTEVRFNPSAANAATKAIEVANRLAGYGDEEEEDDDREIVVRFESGGEFTS